MKVITSDAQVIELGITETSPTIGINDFSRRVTDDFGVTTVVKRAFARTMSLRFALPTSQIDAVSSTLASLRATSALWVADERFSWLSIEGFYKDFDASVEIGELSYCTLTVEGLAEGANIIDLGGDPAPAGRSSTLRLIQPIEITSAMLLATNVPEIDYSTWSAGTSYALGARVISTATHRIYESAAAANLGNDPASSPLWIDIGPTNRWAMFDQALGTATDRNESIIVTIDAGPISAVALLDVAGDTVRVQASGYDRTVPVQDGAITFLDLPNGTGQLTVTIASTGTAAVGTLLVGNFAALGLTEESPSTSITDFSKKNVDEFGEVTVVPRSWAKRMSTRALIRTDALDIVASRIAAVRAAPALWIADDDTDALTIYGFFKDFSIEVGETSSILSLSVEGLSEAPPLPADLPATNWPDVGDTDPLRPKPQDGATVGAVVGDNLVDGEGNPLTAEDVVTSEGTAARVAMIGDFTEAEFAHKVEDSESNITDLFATYGDTASAAASRLGAEAAAAAAELAKTEAQTAASNADDSASASSGHASSAATSASSAEISAVAAQASATTATTKAGQASVSASNAAGSASTAAGHSSSAASDASAAANSKDAAAGSASAAATSATTASTLAGDAALSAVASQNNLIKAEVAASNAQYLDVANAFDFDTGALHAAAGSSATLTAGNGGLLITPTTGTDPYVIKTGLSVQGSRYTRVIVEVTRITKNAGSTWQGQLFWATQGGHSWNASYCVGVPDTTQVGQRTTLTFDIPKLATPAQLADWTSSTITGVRFDFDQFLAGEFKIHSIRIVGPDGAAPILAATIAQQSAVVATDAAASAQTTASLVATMGGASLAKNGGFDDYPSAAVGQSPTHWVLWANPPVHYRVSDGTGGYAVRIPGTAGENAGLRQPLTHIVNPYEYYVLECEVKLNSGKFSGAGIYTNWTDEVGGYITSAWAHFPDSPDQTGAVVGNGVPGTVYRFNKLVRANHANARRFELFIMTHYSGLGSIAEANDITWYKAGVRPATQAEIAAGVALPALEATVGTHASVLATHSSRLAAYLLRTAAGAGTAEIALQALDSGGAAASQIALRADSIKLGSMTQSALDISGGNARFNGILNVGGSSGARLSLQPNILQVFNASNVPQVKLGIF